MAVPLLPLSEYKRYGRQMILDNFGLPGQLKLRSAAVVVVGAGGLGCPALQYLAAAGVGRLGIVDHDTVDISNLHRQILHTEARVGMSKAASAEIALKAINSAVTIIPHPTPLTPQNARTILSRYDIILDCTDNAPTRYLLSDIAVALQKPLISGAAMKYDGQLCIYNLGSDGPCYRCLYPKPPAPETVGSCEETGVLGVVTGTIGGLQALECIKLIAGLHDGHPSLLIFSALSTPPFRSAKLRKKRLTCPACGEEGSRVGTIEKTDYVAFCGGTVPDYEKMGLEEGKVGYRVRGKEMKDAVDSGKAYIIDVRSHTEFGICHLPSSINVPLSELVADPLSHLPTIPSSSTFIVCRLGNDSQIAADALRSVLPEGRMIYDLIGGLRSWSRDVDQNFPVY
ncbi:molybdenum cofactor synthesis 3 [Hysterangium stoloniferum]|nr:molybdenum cofactor synthesis 3 [Hysterangium stoloniferum]